MPSLEISIPKIPAKNLEAVSSSLTSAFISASPGFDKKDFHIFFREYENAAIGGVVWKGGKAPIHLHLMCPRIRRTVKQNIVKSFTDILSGAFENSYVIIHISEHPYDNVGVDGKILSALIPELSKRKFYYETSD